MAYLAVGGLAAALIALVAWVLLRLERGRKAGAVMETNTTNQLAADNTAETSVRFAATPSPR
ncbi:MAG TPA: hypothetical protein VES62_03185 [Thermoleophilaceae bacterium]|nr:hypothetical protein [Thermoleophilaceae bacterium]